MKKFEFALESVLGYKQQVLDAATADYSAALAQADRQQTVVQRAEEQLAQFSRSYRVRQMEGMTAAEALAAQNALQVLEKKILQETEQLKKLRNLAERKRQSMVEAKQETATIEKLKEKKWTSYTKAVQKSEEMFIEELVCASRSSSAAGSSI